MSDASLPPANLILQALHGIRSDLKSLQSSTNERLEGLGERLERLESLQVATNERLDRLETGLDQLAKRTTKGFLETNTKLAQLSKTVGQHEKRLDHLLREGLGAEVRDLRRRVDRLESARRLTPPKKSR